MTKLNEFVSSVKQGMAKTSRFTVQLKLPEVLANKSNLVSKMSWITLFCDQAQLPGLSYMTNQIRSYGEVKEVPYEKIYEPVTLSFYVDADMIVKELFDEWMSMIQDPITRDYNFPSVYITDTIDITVENNDEQSVYKYTLNRAYPKAIAPIQLDYAGKEVMKLSVTFTYQYASMKRLTPSKLTGPTFDYQAPLATYNYGYDAITQIPDNYFNNFTSFQQQVNNADFTLGGVRSLATTDTLAAVTGYGGIFK